LDVVRVGLTNRTRWTSSLVASRQAAVGGSAFPPDICRHRTV